MQKLFDFDRIREWFRRGHSLRFDAMHAVTGPYAQRIFVEQLGAPLNSSRTRARWRTSAAAIPIRT